MSDKTPTVSADSSAPAQQEVIAKIEVPYAVHRWFASGEGWAWHPDMDLKQVQSWAVRILAKRSEVWQPTSDADQVLEVQRQEQLSCDTEHKLCFVYRHYADKECPDPKAKQRFPTVLIVALVRDLNDAEISEVQKQLDALRHEELPQQAGCQDSFKLVVSRIATPSANDEPVTTANTPASIQPDVHPDVQGPARRLFKPVMLCVSVAVLLAVGIIIYLGLVSPEGNDWSQVKSTRSSVTEQNWDGGSSLNVISHFAATPSLDNLNTKSVADQSPGSAAPVQPQPENATRWRQQAAEAMLRHLKRWHKSEPLVEELGLNRKSNPKLEVVRRLLEVNLENKGSPTCGTVVTERENQIMSRFFLVLSQEPVRHLLNDDVVKYTWQGKFILLFHEVHPYAKGDCPRWYPKSEQELRQWLLDQEQWFIKHIPGAPEDHVAGALNIRSHGAPDAISDLVDRVAGRIDYFDWKQALQRYGGKFEDCTDPRLKKWVENFRASTNGQAREQ